MKKYLYSLLGLLFFLPVVSFASIALDTTYDCGNVSTCSYTNSGSVLLLGVVGDTVDNTPVCTWNGTSMDLIGKDVPNSGERWMYLFLLNNPDNGTHSTSCSGSTVRRQTLISYTGVNLSGNPDDSVHGGSSASPLTLTLNTVPSNSWTVSFFGSDDGTQTASTNCYDRINHNTEFFCDSDGSVSGSVSMSATGSSMLAGIMLSLLEDTGGGGGGFSVSSTTVATTTIQIISDMGFSALLLFFISFILSIWIWKSFML